jgi:hypothetical protein
MRAWLRTLWDGFIRWRNSNREAHRANSNTACCSSPDSVYAARRRPNKSSPWAPLHRVACDANASLLSADNAKFRWNEGVDDVLDVGVHPVFTFMPGEKLVHRQVMHDIT